MSSLPQTVGRATAQVLRRSAPLGNRAPGSSGAHSLIGSGLATLARGLGGEDQQRRHPLQPAAVRVERSRSRNGDHRGDQVAVTMWFGAGPALPSMTPPAQAGRAAARLGGAVLLAALAAAAATAMAGRQAPRGRTQIVDAPTAESRDQGA